MRKRGATQTAAVLSTEEQAVRSLSWQGNGSHLHVSLLGSRCQTLETLTDECRLSNCIQTFLPISKITQTKTPHAGTGLGVSDCWIVSVLAVSNVSLLKVLFCFDFDPECRCFQPLDNPEYSCSG